MSCLILGGAGVAGTAVFKQAARADIDVSIGDISSVNGGEAAFRVDVTDLESFPDDVEFDGIVNLAAVHTDDV